MIDESGITLVLRELDHDLRALNSTARTRIERAQKDASKLDALEDRVRRLSDELAVSKDADRAKKPAKLPAITAPEHRPRSWEDLVSSARQASLDRHETLENARDLDALLRPGEAERIERQFSGGFGVESNLDAIDVVAMIAAGIAAAMVDFMIVRIPKDMTYLGQYTQNGSPLTAFFRSLDVSDDNQLAHWFRVSFDKVKGVPVAGFSPRTHRLQTFGHDPLLGLVVGVIDVLRGGLTAVGRDGRLVSMSGQAAAEWNPVTVLVRVVGHLLSDVLTKMGIPAPGFSLMQFLQVGHFGDNERTVAELARFMYLKGYDSRHFLTMSTSVGAAELVLRCYFWLRRRFDPEYDSDCLLQTHLAAARTMGDHPRLVCMSVVAHGIAVAANAGKIVAYQGNPLAINYAQWLRFVHSLYRWTRLRLISTSNVLMRRAEWNLHLLESGWGSEATNDPEFPTLEG